MLPEQRTVRPFVALRDTMNGDSRRSAHIMRARSA
jgi:hypothetical protein